MAQHLSLRQRRSARFSGELSRLAPRRLPRPAPVPEQIAPAPGLVTTADGLTLALRLHRQRQHLTLQALAQAAGLSKSVLARAEVGASVLSVQDLARLARVLQVPPWELVQFADWPGIARPWQAHHTAQEP